MAPEPPDQAAIDHAIYRVFATPSGKALLDLMEREWRVLPLLGPVTVRLAIERHLERIRI